MTNSYFGRTKGIDAIIHIFFNSLPKKWCDKTSKAGLPIINKIMPSGFFRKGYFSANGAHRGILPTCMRIEAVNMNSRNKICCIRKCSFKLNRQNATFRIFYAESVDISSNRRYEIMLGEYINHQIRCALSPFQVWLLEWYYSPSFLRKLFTLMTLRKGSRPRGSELKRCACFCLAILQEKPLPRLTSLLQQDLQESAFAQSRLPYLNGEKIWLMCRQYLQ